MTNNYSEHFSVSELQCPATKKIALQNGFIEELELLRSKYSKPMAVTSCCRSEEHNKKIGGHSRSLHIMGNPYHDTDTCAVDIRRPHGTDLHRLLSIALECGWSVGLARSFVHLDRRTQFINLRPVIYTY